MNIFLQKTSSKTEPKPKPKNKLQAAAMSKGINTLEEFRRLVKRAGVSDGLAFTKWHSGKMGKSQADKLLAIANALGYSSIEDIFDP